MTEVEFHVDPAHPAFAGHFPGQPILPGVVLLDEVMRAIEAIAPADDAEGSDALPFIDRFQLAVAKFHQPAGPDARLIIRVDQQPTGAIAFRVTQGEAMIASGSFVTKARAACAALHAADAR